MYRAVNRARADHGSERGFFMVWFALLFVTLLGFAGLALEFNRWESIGTRVQKAADAAALAGAVFLPDNLTQAAATAKSTASKNGFTHGTNGVTITAVKARLPNQLKVTITVPTKNPWGAIVGYGDSTIKRVAVAEYQLPQNLGSPQNSYGNNPERTAADPASPQFWGNVFGPSSFKVEGRRVPVEAVRHRVRQLPERWPERGLRPQRVLLRHRSAGRARRVRSTSTSSTPPSCTSATTAPTATR